MAKRRTYLDQMDARTKNFPIHTEQALVALGLAMVADAIYEASDAGIARVVGPRGTQFKNIDVEDLGEDDDGK